MVYDVLGRMVKRIEKSDGLIRFGEDMPVGYYMAVVTQGNIKMTIKLVKQYKSLLEFGEAAQVVPPFL